MLPKDSKNEVSSNGKSLQEPSPENYLQSVLIHSLTQVLNYR